MKKICFLLVLVLLCPLGVSFAENDADDYFYTLNHDGTITIQRYSRDAVFYDMDSTMPKLEITIPSEINGHRVTAIDDFAFFDCETLVSVSIPEGVTSIGNSAFRECSRLVSVSIPDSLTSIGNFAFFHCASLASVSIPEGVTSIGNSAFYNCGNLSSVTLPDSVTTIGDSAFFNCHRFTTVNIPDSVTTIGKNPFAGCYDLTEFVLSADNPNFTLIDNVLFDKRENKLICYPSAFTASSYEIPQGTQTIGKEAFYHCSDLTCVTLPDSVVCIDDNAFHSCDGLLSVSIPSSVTTMGSNPFDCCDALTDFMLASDNPNYEVIDGALFDKREHKFICYPCACTASSYEIPQGTQIIGTDAIYHCDHLFSITIPDSITTIEDCVLSYCDNLLSVTIPD